MKCRRRREDVGLEAADWRDLYALINIVHYGLILCFNNQQFSEST